LKFTEQILAVKNILIKKGYQNNKTVTISNWEIAPVCKEPKAAPSFEESEKLKSVSIANPHLVPRKKLQ
jgi:hypothetical protein